MTTNLRNCYDCGSSIPGHHTATCDMAGKTGKLDLPSQPGTHWWNSQLPDKRSKHLQQLIDRAKAYMNSDDERDPLAHGIYATDDDAVQLYDTGWRPDRRVEIGPCPVCKNPMEYGDEGEECRICMVCVELNK